MKLSALTPYSFRALLPKVKARIAEEARRRLIVYPDGDMVQRHLSVGSTFCRSAVSMGYLTQAQMNRAAQRYRLGMSRDGGVIFWQIGFLNEMYDGKIMYYRSDCHRDHNRNPTWVSHLLRKDGYLPEDWKTEHCLFGLHLLQDSKKNVAVVESEKTAVIMSAVKPDYTWLATGGKTELNVAKLKPLQGRRVILFPDTDETGKTYQDWYEIAQAASDVFGHPVTVSSILEQKATEAQKAGKIDIADLIFPL